ncbi:MAG: asparagine synthase B [Saprospiraceae bacterium]|nr:asparagine synthase B [Saprospiraceae bacterium]
MCGIVAIFNIKESNEKMRTQAINMAKKVRHRGPDWPGIYCGEHTILAHERLAIVDPQSGGQPLYTEDGKIVLAVNGEIYNHDDIRVKYDGKYPFLTKSDCEVILALYRDKGPNFIEELNGILDLHCMILKKTSFLVARDHMGIIPLYHGWDEFGQYYVASELKALEGVCNKIEVFPPGHYYYSPDGEPKKWYTRDWMDFENVKNNETDIALLRKGLEDAVHRQLMSDVPYGVLLSGGLDSSIISAVAKKYAAKRVESQDKSEAWYPQLHSFAVGLKDAPDLIAARKVADHIGSIHHEIHFTIQEGLDAIRDVVYHLETYDITTIRASTPMFLMARVIKSMGIKMVLSGEGSDEIFGGYLYFHKAPNAKALHEETVRKLDKLHLYDNLRANKSLAAWGVEGRVPFLDKEFMDIAMRINPEDKLPRNGRIEKWVLRKAFEDMLPESIAWRQKEQFSDGVGYNWIDTLKDLVQKSVTDEQLATAAFKFPDQTPSSKEEYYYRSIFESHFPSRSAALCVPSVPSVACSSPVALEWDAAFKNMNDPSGRAVKDVHTMT